MYFRIIYETENRVVVVELDFCTSTIHSMRNLLLFYSVVNFVIKASKTTLISRIDLHKGFSTSPEYRQTTVTVWPGIVLQRRSNFREWRNIAKSANIQAHVWYTPNIAHLVAI